MLDKYASYNKFSNRSMDMINCMSEMHQQIKNLAIEGSQENIDNIAKLAENFEVLSESYKTSLLNAIKELSGYDIDIIEGIQDEKGVRL